MTPLCPTTRCRQCPRQNRCARKLVILLMALTAIGGIAAIAWK